MNSVLKHTYSRFFGLWLLTALCAAPCVILPNVAVAQPDAMVAGPGEKAGSLNKGEPLAVALRREKLDATQVSLAMQSIRQLFDFRQSRTGDKYVFRLSSNKKLEMLRYQRGQHIYEANLGPDDTYTARLLDPNDIKTAQVDILQPPHTEDGDDEIDVERPANLGAEPPAQTPPPADETNNLHHDAPAALDDVRPEDDYAQESDPKQPEDAALAGLPSPDEQPEGLAEPHADANDADSEDKGTKEQATPQPERVQPPIHHNENIVPPIELDGQARIIPLPQQQAPQRPDTSKPYSPLSLALACIGIIALIIGIILSIFPAWRARQHFKSADLTIEDEIVLCKDQRLTIVSRKNHTYLVAVSSKGTRLLTCCDDDEETIRAWTFFKQKSYWHQLGHKTISDKQLDELIRTFETSSVHDRPEPRAIVNQPSTPTHNNGPILSSTPTLGGMVARQDEARDKSDDLETLEVPEMSDFWLDRNL